MRIADVQRRRDGVVACERAGADQDAAIVLGPVLQKGGEAKVLAHFGIGRIGKQPSIGAMSQPECLRLIALHKRI